MKISRIIREVTDVAKEYNLQFIETDRTDNLHPEPSGGVRHGERGDSRWRRPDIRWVFPHQLLPRH